MINHGLAVGGRSRTDEGELLVISRGVGDVLRRARCHDRRRDLDRAAATCISLSHNELLQDTRGNLGFRVDCIDVRNREHVAHNHRAGAGVDDERGARLSRGGVGEVRGRHAGAVREVRQVAGFHKVKASGPANHAVAILLGNLGRCVEERRESRDKVRHVVIGEERCAIALGSKVLLKLALACKDVRIGDSRRDVVHRVIDVLVHGSERIRLNRRGQDGHGGLKNAAAEVVKIKRQLGRAEVHVDAFLSGDGQVNLAFRRVLNANHRAGPDRVLVRKTNAERVANLCA